jgi:hypothetical protein
MSGGAKVSGGQTVGGANGACAAPTAPNDRTRATVSDRIDRGTVVGAQRQGTSFSIQSMRIRSL